MPQVVIAVDVTGLELHHAVRRWRPDRAADTERAVLVPCERDRRIAFDERLLVAFGGLGLLELAPDEHARRPVRGTDADRDRSCLVPVPGVVLVIARTPRRVVDAQLGRDALVDADR